MNNERKSVKILDGTIALLLWAVPALFPELTDTQLVVPDASKPRYNSQSASPLLPHSRPSQQSPLLKHASNCLAQIAVAGGSVAEPGVVVSYSTQAARGGTSRP